MSATWPVFDTPRDSPTIATLHLISQMPGKLRVAHAPWVNHGWQVTLHPVASGLVTAPTAATDGRSFTLGLDLCEHALTLRVSDGAHDRIAFADGLTIANFHRDFVAMLERHGLPSNFNGKPNEIPDASPFADDHAPRAYDPASAERLRDMLALIVPIFEKFRAGFGGKASPVQYWWGSFDLAVTRFSGRSAPPHPGGVPGLPDRVTREAYSHEESSAGFWPGSAAMAADPIFYSYAYPEPDGFRDAAITPGRFDKDLGEYVLPYADVANAADPEATLLAFLQSTYAAAADLASWDRAALDRSPTAP
jgi:Family of unknown function (DUF5996)